MTCACGQPILNVAVPSKSFVCTACFMEGFQRRGHEGGQNVFRDLPRLRQVQLVSGREASALERAA